MRQTHWEINSTSRCTRWRSSTEHLSVSQNWTWDKAVLVTTAIVNREPPVTPEMYAVSIAHNIQKITASLGLLLYLSFLLLFCFSYIPLSIPLSVFFLFVALSFHNRSLNWLFFFFRGEVGRLCRPRLLDFTLVWFRLTYVYGCFRICFIHPNPKKKT